ncbi:Gx transporter family protein [Candidatus Zixiibacteriota bacterium]
MPKSTHKLIHLSMLVSVGLILYILETNIPQPLPWARIGLANLAALMALVLWGFWEALAVALGRIVLGSLITGALLSPVFPFALAGGLASLVVMGLSWRFLRPIFSVVGVSILGALAHNIAQLYLAYVLYIQRGQIFYLLPLLLLSTVLSGFFVGAVVALVTGRKALQPWMAGGNP